MKCKYYYYSQLGGRYMCGSERRDDLTIIYMTYNRLPRKWQVFHRKHIESITDGFPIVTISRDPMDWGTNLLQNEYGILNLFQQHLRGAKEAKTEYIAIVEDDTLYPADHFSYRPPKDKFAYNFNRWNLFTWKTRKPFYYHKPRPGNGTMICSRDLLITALENRMNAIDKLPVFHWTEPGTTDRVVTYDIAGFTSFYTSISIVALTHPFSVDELSQKQRKNPWPIYVYELPQWGKAEQVLYNFG